MAAASPVAQLVTNSACNAGDSGSIPGLGRSTGEGIATHSSILRLPRWLRCWRIHLQCRKHGFDPWRREFSLELPKLLVCLQPKVKSYLYHYVCLCVPGHGTSLGASKALSTFVKNLGHISYCAKHSFNHTLRLWENSLILLMRKLRHSEIIINFLTSMSPIEWLSSVGKESVYSAGDPGSIPGSERSPGEGNGNLLQYSCLENPMDKGACQTIVHGVTRVGRLSN